MFGGSVLPSPPVVLTLLMATFLLVDDEPVFGGDGRRLRTEYTVGREMVPLLEVDDDGRQVVPGRRIRLLTDGTLPRLGTVRGMQDAEASLPGKAFAPVQQGRDLGDRRVGGLCSEALGHVLDARHRQHLPRLRRWIGGVAAATGQRRQDGERLGKV